MTRTTRPIRLGRISYTNVWPVFYYLPQHGSAADIEIIDQVPSLLNGAMLREEIDIGPISSFAYGHAYPNYVLYPDLSVSAFGKVGSILLFHREPLEKIVNQTFALPTTSATSQNLLKIILQKFYGGRPNYLYMTPQLDDMMKVSDAALLIGDDAIAASWNNDRYYVTDLGEKWKECTGLWMTFAVWAIRKEALKQYPGKIAALFQAFNDSKRRSLLEPEGMIGDAIRKIGGTESYWRDYFNGLSYDFGAEQWQGLTTYFQYSKELGLLDKEISIEIWSDNTIAKATQVSNRR